MFVVVFSYTHFVLDVVLVVLFVVVFVVGGVGFGGEE